jgi:ribosomal protein S12 methylthiotransferase accessory factor
VLIPADVCVFATAGRHPLTPPSAAWYPSTSNGSATGTDPFAAALSGLYELLERDSFLLTWHHRPKLSHLVVDGDDPMMDEVQAIVGRARLNYALVDLSEVHEVPTVLAITWRIAGDQPVYGLGASAGPGLRGAALKALAESASCQDYVYRRFLANDRKRLEPDEVTTFDDHPEFYIDADRHHLLEFLLRPEQIRPLSPAVTDSVKWSTRLQRLAKALARKGIRTYAVDITPVEGEALGLVTYKVVSPDLIPLNAGHHARHLGHPRLLTEPVRLGWRLDPPTLQDICHDPHPFP